MFRANIYSAELLTPAYREAINDGLDMVATYMGETAMTNELQVRLPFNERGKVDPHKVDVGKLDPMVEIHVMAIPMGSGVGDRVGLAALGQGSAYVDTSLESSHLVRSVTAHEVSHSLGFVLPSAEQFDPTSEFHCIDATCLMHKGGTIDTVQKEIQTEQEIESKNILARLGILRRTRSITTTEQVPVIIFKDQYDFCLPCKIDLRDHGERKLNGLRYSRLMSRRVLGASTVQQ